MDDRTPVLVGAGQLVQREGEPLGALEPLAMLERVARDAAEDASGGERLLREIDAIGIVHVIAWKPENGPRLLAERLGATARHEVTTAVGGEIGVTLINHLAERIAAGKSQVALAVGCNNFRTLMRARREKLRLPWTVGGTGTPELLGANRGGSSEREVLYGLKLPTEIYPLFENGLRAHRGLDLETHRWGLGRLFARFTEVAAKNPYAWFPVLRSAEELVGVTPDNRMIAFPYPKYLNAVLETDQAAGVLLVSTGTARALGIPEQRWVTWMGGAHDVEAAWFPSERPNFHSSPALARALRCALARAGVSLDGIDCIDFYSCFPASVEMACEELGLSEDDPRGFTVTGGLPYAGGPGSNYTLHAVAAMIERLRERPGAKGLVTGNGWYLTKHSACVLGAGLVPGSPGPNEGAGPSGEPEGPVAIADRAEGRGTLETYTVLFDREGAPARGIAIGRLSDGRRFLANTPDDRALLEAFVAREEVGREGRVTHAAGRNVFTPS